MMVFTKAPRRKSFKAFNSAKAATAWLKVNAERVINVRTTSYGMIIANYYVR